MTPLRQHAAPRAVIGQTCSTQLPRTQTYKAPLTLPLVGQRLGVDGRVAMAGDLAAEPEPAGGG